MRFALMFAPLLGLAALGTAVLLSAEEEEKKPFTPPTAEEQRAAIGETERLSAVLRRAFEPTDAFSPIPAPGPHDWLARFPEPGQSYPAYVKSKPNRPDRTRKKIYLQPIGEIESDSAPSLVTLERFTEAFFGLEVELRPTISVKELEARSRTHPGTGKRQLRTGDIRRALEERLPADAYCLLGVTMEDLYPSERWNFVFGEASLEERVGVYSFARYDPRFFGRKAPEDVETLVRKRSAKVLVHETGHMFGIHHCIHFRCVMNGSNHLAESDSRPLTLCPVCLRKLHHAAGFDVVVRYEKLEARCRAMAFTVEARWFAGRLKRVGAPR